ncbi:RDD family protein [Alishewanella sp. SMS8]|uniref:RDD family protein n=1 Tax=Alishewanella sp. SMS8 TaxID=2994676 RepID=UPI0027407CBB|nr:RDD family protein [Alishewanella sp. SMS8]MDP4945160.1 RDD family protein [Alishewanella sp.]MDP5206582.1 RDD family protein [Alishewanella sp. SMS9]MDP5036335.1 RDD family protein [Alishewanella sp.]MDP5186702.1 RDD family protein [Alishewanella sp.]MDP5460723.1 RDD family protein [Alishewanella sp. SMS8]
MENQEYAGFWIRFGAVLIDLVVIIIVCFVPLTLIYGEEYWVGEQLYYGFWDLIFSYILPFVATIWFWLRFFGTPGKMALRLKIVDAKTGGKLSLGQAIGRYFAYIVAALPLLLGYIWVGVDKRKQGLHDKLAGTVVIRQLGKEPVKFDQNA